MKNREAALVRELMALYAKYGESAFEAAVREIRTGDTMRLIADTAEDLQRAAQRAGIRATRIRPQTPKKTKRDLAAERIVVLRNSGRKIDGVIAEFLNKILSREILPTPLLVRDYMAFIGVPMSGRHLDRYDALVEIMDHLRSLPDAEARQSVDAVRHIDQPVSSLQQWTDIIVKPDRN